MAENISSRLGQDIDTAEGKPGGLRKNYFLKAFLLGLGLSFVIFIPYILRDGGRFLFYGDFNVQQVPFYRLAHDAVLSGNIGWSHLTDLGANFIGSYSFYLLGSPFFWLTLPFPGEWLQYLMGPLLILKFACASLTGYIFLRRYVRNQNHAVLGAILYAFSGFSVYNVFFNHFHEAIVFFPLLLAALDEYMFTRRRGLFALMVFACCTVNYYFFVGQVAFCLIYFFIRLATGSYKINLRDFLLLGLEAVLGLGLSCILLVPSVLAVIQNDRVSNPINGWNALLYDKPQRYVHILQSLFFPPDLAARPNFAPDSESKWASLGAWLPLFSMSGVIAWMQQRRKHWLKKLLYFLFACAFIPVLNSAFQLFNGSYYARWFYMLTLVMSLATIMSLEDAKVDWKRAIKWTTLITGFMALAIGFMPKIVSEDGKESLVLGLSKYPTRFWSYVAIAIISLALLIYLFRYVEKQSFLKNAMVSLSIVAVLYSSFYIALGKTQSQDPYEHLIPYALSGGKNLPIDDLNSVRSDFYESLDNSGMFWMIPNIQAFQSIVPGSVMDFYDYIGVERGTASRPETEHYGLRALSSVRWLFDDDHDEEYFAGNNYDDPAMPGWVYYGNSNGFDIWENEYFVPMGFTYSSYLPESEAQDLPDKNKELLMLKTAIVPDADVQKWATLLPKFDLTNVSYTEDKYFTDCIERAALSCQSFVYTNKGFEAAFSAPANHMVFFSVPYEDGWRATVNGEPAEILKTNIGFMSVQVPEGEEIRINFTYSTPGMSMGILISVLSLFALAAYIYLARILVKSKKTPSIKKGGQRRPAKFEKYCAASGAHFKKNTKGMLLKKNREKV